jgi:hypothetical protein
VIEGEIVLLVDGVARRARAGETHRAPKGVPHSYRVVSDRARWLITTANGDFERFVGDVSRPAARAELPEVAGPPTAEEQAALVESAARNNIDLIGPPSSEEVAEAA